MEEQFQAMQRELVRLGGLVESQRAELEALRAAQAQGAKGGGKGAAASALDLRQLGRPEIFPADGAKPSWRDWSQVFRAFAGASHSDMQEALELASLEGDLGRLHNAVLTTAGARRVSQELYFMLTMLVRGQALDLVINAGDGEGLLAWRALLDRFEPKTRYRYASCLISLLGFDFSGDVVAKLAQFDREVADVERLSSEKVPDSIKICLAIRNIDDNRLKKHLILQAERLNQWAAFKEEIIAIRRIQMATQNFPTPMDIGEVQLDALGKGQSKGKLAAGRKCYNCGKEGHLAKDCKQPKKPKPLAQAYSQGSSKGGKNVKCYACGDMGHIAKDCKKPRRVHDLEQTGDGWNTAASGTAQSTGTTYQADYELPSHLGSLFLNSLDLGVLTLEQAAEQGSLFLNSLDLCALTLEQVAEQANLSTFQVQQLQRLGVLDNLARSSQASDSKIRWGIGSCAAATVLPKRFAGAYPKYHDKDTGRSFSSATGQSVDDEGVKLLIGKLGDGPRRAFRARVVEAQRPLMAVSEIVDKGNGVFFSRDGSYIVDKEATLPCKRAIDDHYVKSRDKPIRIQRNRNVFECEMELESYDEKTQRELAKSQGFQAAGPRPPP